MNANLSAAAAKTLTTIAAAEYIDCYARTAGIDCRTLNALVRKGYLVKLEDGCYRHAITDAGRAALGMEIPSTEIAVVVLDAEIVEERVTAPNGIIYLPADHKTIHIDDEGFGIDLDRKGLRTDGYSLWTR